MRIERRKSSQIWNRKREAPPPMTCYISNFDSFVPAQLMQLLDHFLIQKTVATRVRIYSFMAFGIIMRSVLSWPGMALPARPTIQNFCSHEILYMLYWFQKLKPIKRYKFNLYYIMTSLTIRPSLINDASLVWSRLVISSTTTDDIYPICLIFSVSFTSLVSWGTLDYPCPPPPSSSSCSLKWECPTLIFLGPC